MLNLIFSLICWCLGHPTVPTGRSSWAMAEYRCSRCSAILVSHRDHGRRLIPLTPELDILFSSIAKLESLALAARDAGVPLIPDPAPDSPPPNQGAPDLSPRRSIKTL